MPETIQSAGSTAVDREFDTLWARVRSLENALKSLKTGVSGGQTVQRVNQGVPGTILVQEADGDPSVSVQGLTFDNGTVTESDGMARITGISGVKARKNSAIGADTATRPRLNFIEGSGVTLTVGDDGVDNEIDLTIAAASGNVNVLKETITYANLFSASFALSYDLVNLLPAGAFVLSVKARVTTGFLGGVVSALTVGFTIFDDVGSTTSSTFSIYGAGSTNVQISPFNGVPAKHLATTAPRLTFTSTGANLAALTQGSLTVWIVYATLT